MKSRKYICESSLGWILNFRKWDRVHQSLGYTNEHCLKNLKKLWNNDNHTKQSWSWVLYQSKKIDKVGWDEWWKSTNGPEGFSYTKKQ